MGEWSAGWADRCFRDAMRPVKKRKRRCGVCGVRKSNLLAHAAAKHPEAAVSGVLGTPTPPGELTMLKPTQYNQHLIITTALGSQRRTASDGTLVPFYSFECLYCNSFTIGREISRTVFGHQRCQKREEKNQENPNTF